MRRMSLRNASVIAVGLAVVAVALFGVVTYIDYQQELNRGFFTGPTYTSDQRRQQFKEREKKEIKYSSFEDAKANLPAVLRNVKLPNLERLHGKSPKTAAATKNLMGVYLLMTTDDTNAAPGELSAVFAPKLSQKDKDDGIDPSRSIFFQVQPDSTGGTTEDIDAYMAQEAQAVADGMSRADTPIVRIDVNGNAGLAHEPGYNVIGSAKRPRGGSVTWWENGFAYHIHGSDGPNGTSVETMLEIAEEIAQSEPAQ